MKEHAVSAGGASARGARLALASPGRRRNRAVTAGPLATRALGPRVGPALPLVAAAAIAGVLAAGPLACSAEHDDLGLTDAASSSTGQGASGGEGASGPSASSTGVGASGGDGGAGPVGPTRLTLVNGVVDVDEVKLCAIGYPGGEGAAEPAWPSDPLAFGAARVVDPLDELLPAGVDVQLHVLSGDLSLAAGASCGALVGADGAGGSGGSGTGGGNGGELRITALPLLPASAFASGKSVLLVTAGCVGALEGTSGKVACGEGYAPRTPTATLVAVGMDQDSTFDRVGLQAVHASLAMPQVDVRIAPGNDSNATQLLAPLLSFGGIGPNPTYDALDLPGYGTLNEVGFPIHQPGDSQLPLDELPLDEALERGGLTTADFDDGRNLVLVAVGAAPGVNGTAAFRALALTAVRATPETR